MGVRNTSHHHASFRRNYGEGIVSGRGEMERLDREREREPPFRVLVWQLPRRYLNKSEIVCQTHSFPAAMSLVAAILNQPRLL